MSGKLLVFTKCLAAALLFVSLGGSVSAVDPCFADCQYMFPEGWYGYADSPNPQCCYITSGGSLARGSCAEHQPNLFRCDPGIVIVQHGAGANVVLPGNLDIGKQISSYFVPYGVLKTKEPCECGYDESGLAACFCEPDLLEWRLTHECIDCEHEGF